MTIILDTHIVIWLMMDPEKVSRNLRLKIEEADKRYISVVTFAEVAFKHRKNGASFPFSIGHAEQALSDLRAIELPLSRMHVFSVNQLPMRHRDPFDHLLMAQAICEDVELATVDSNVLAYSADGLKIA